MTEGDFRTHIGQKLLYMTMWTENKDSHSCMQHYLTETLKLYF